MVVLTSSLPQGGEGAGRPEAEGGGSVNPSIHLLLPDNLLDSFGCLFGCAGGLNGGGQQPGAETATISAPIEVSALDIVRPEDLDIPGLNLDDLTSHSCNQEGCSGQGLAAIPHPESRPVIVLLGEDMDNNASEIIVLGNEEDQHTLQQSGLFAGILNQLFQADPASVLSFDVPRLEQDIGGQHQQPPEESPLANNQPDEIAPADVQPEKNTLTDVQQEDKNLIQDEEQEERKPRISSAIIDDFVEENVFIIDETTSKIPTTTTVAFGTADSDIYDEEKDSVSKETETRQGRKQINNLFDEKLLPQSTPLQGIIDVTHDTRLIEKDFPIRDNLVEAPSGSAGGSINNLDKGFRRPSFRIEDDFIDIPKLKPRFGQKSNAKSTSNSRQKNPGQSRR